MIIFFCITLKVQKKRLNIRKFHVTNQACLYFICLNGETGSSSEEMNSSQFIYAKIKKKCLTYTCIKRQIVNGLHHVAH